MKNKSLVIGMATLMAVSMLSGCQSVQDQIGKKLAEGAMSKMAGGDVKIDDKTGSVSIKTKDGSAVIGGGDSRPASAPAELPSLPSAKDFSWLGSNEGGLLSFKVAGNDYKAVCDQEETMMKSAGWVEKKSSFVMETDGMRSKSFYKDGKVGSLSCTFNSGDDSVGVLMSSSVDKNAKAAEEKDSDDSSKSSSTSGSSEASSGSSDSSSTKGNIDSGEYGDE